MPLEGFQLFCDRNDHFPSVFLQFTIAGNLSRANTPGYREKKLRTKQWTGSVYFCNDDLIRFKGNHRMYLAVS